MRKDLFTRDINHVPLTDFFGSDIKVEFQDDLFKRENMSFFNSYTPKHSNSEYKKKFVDTENVGNNNVIELSFQQSVSFIDIKIVGILLIGVVSCFIASIF